MNSIGMLSEHVRIDHAYDANGAHDGTAFGMLDMNGWDGCLVLVFGLSVASSATNHVTGFKIVSNTTAAGGGTDHDIGEAVTTEGGTTVALTTADMGTAAAYTSANSEFMALDVRQDEMYPGDRYIAAVTTGTGTYPIHIVYLRYRGDAGKDIIQETRLQFQYHGNL
jgi:hypothetical protein